MTMDKPTSAEAKPIDDERGQRGPENAIRKHLPSVRDRAATLQCDVARLNAVSPDFTRVDKSTASLNVAINWLDVAFEIAISSAAKKEANRRELTLELAYSMVLDMRRREPTIHQDRAINGYVKRSEAFIYDAYNTMADRYPMQRNEIFHYRGLWCYTALAIRRCAIQPYRHILGRKIFELSVSGALSDNDCYWLARVLISKMANSEPRYHIESSCYEALQNTFKAARSDLDKIIEAMRSYRSTPTLQTIEKRDRLVAALKIIADSFRELDLEARDAFARCPLPFWEAQEIVEIDPYDSKYK